ncbi:acetyltransferase [Salmonella enterica]|nr:acetyltransferase [Salmonella enterica]
MMTLKYPVPCVCGSDNPDNFVFTLPPQGEPAMSVEMQTNLQRLSEHIRQRLNDPVAVTCHPHRVGLSSCVAVTVEGRLRRAVNILITVSGQGSWPAEEEYQHPRWYITVPDAADMVYLVLWLNSLIVH